MATSVIAPDRVSGGPALRSDFRIRCQYSMRYLRRYMRRMSRASASRSRRAASMAASTPTARRRSHLIPWLGSWTLRFRFSENRGQNVTRVLALEIRARSWLKSGNSQDSCFPFEHPFRCSRKLQDHDRITRITGLLDANFNDTVISPF